MVQRRLYTDQGASNLFDHVHFRMAHALVAPVKAPIRAKDASVENEDTFDIYDPRNPINKRRRQKDRKK